MLLLFYFFTKLHFVRCVRAAVRSSVRASCVSTSCDVEHSSHRQRPCEDQCVEHKFKDMFKLLQENQAVRLVIYRLVKLRHRPRLGFSVTVLSNSRPTLS